MAGAPADLDLCVKVVTEAGWSCKAPFVDTAEPASTGSVRAEALQHNPL